MHHLGLSKEYQHLASQHSDLGHAHDQRQAKKASIEASHEMLTSRDQDLYEWIPSPETEEKASEAQD